MGETLVIKQLPDCNETGLLSLCSYYSFGAFLQASEMIVIQEWLQ